MDLVLASTSPQRRALLTMLGVSFRVVAPAYDEVPIPGTPEEVVQERARGKARAVAGQTTDRPVLGVDTEVVVEGGVVLGQPADAVEARAETQVDHVGREATQQRRLTRQAVDGAHEAIFNGVASKGVVDGHDGADRVDRRRLALVADDLFSGQVLARARPCQ